MMRRLRRRWGLGDWPGRVRLDAKRHRAMFDQAFWLVRAYYAVMLFFAYEEMMPLWRKAIDGGTIDPLWPVFWTTDIRFASTFLMVMLITTAFLAVVLPDRRWPKIAVFVAFLMATAFRASFGLGSINHSNHFWLWLALCFCFLPSGGRDDLQSSFASRYRFLITFWFTQALILLFYSMSGFWKVIAAIEALTLGNFSGFHPDALAQITAWKMIQNQYDSPLGPLLLNYPLAGWPAHLWVIYVELVAIIVLFRPALHRLWGAMLVLFHVGTFLLLNIPFSKHVLVLTLLLVWSPFFHGQTNVGAILASLPGLAWLFRRPLDVIDERMPNAGSAMLAYDGECIFCSRYVAMLRLRRDYDLQLINARDQHPFIDDIRANGFCLDEGMVLKINGHFYHGDNALNLLALMSDENNLFSRIANMLFRRQRLAGYLYPALAAGRRLTLWILMRKRLEY